MYPDIEKAIKLIDSQIEKLKQAKKTLLEAFGGNINSEPILTQSQIIKKGKSKRKDEVINLLQKEGPLKAKDIIEKTGIPRGTISYLLNDKETFINNKDHKWDIVREEKGSDPRTDESEPKNNGELGE